LIFSVPVIIPLGIFKIRADFSVVLFLSRDFIYEKYVVQHDRIYQILIIIGSVGGKLNH
jgi:hypothetical protein